MAINTFQTASPQTAMATQLYGSALLNKRNLFNDMYNTLFDNKAGIVPQWDLGAKKVHTSNIMRDAQRLHQDEVNSYLENGGSLLDWLDENYDSKDGFLYNREDPNLYKALGAKQNAIKNQNTQQLYDNIMGLNNEQMNERLKAGDNFYSWFNSPKYATPTAEMRQSIDNKIANQQEMNRTNYKGSLLRMSDEQLANAGNMTAGNFYGKDVGTDNTALNNDRNVAQNNNNNILLDKAFTDSDNIYDYVKAFNQKDVNGNPLDDKVKHANLAQKGIRPDLLGDYFKDLGKADGESDKVKTAINTLKYDNDLSQKAEAYNIVKDYYHRAIDEDPGLDTWSKNYFKKQATDYLDKLAKSDIDADNAYKIATQGQALYRLKNDLRGIVPNYNDSIEQTLMNNSYVSSKLNELEKKDDRDRAKSSIKNYLSTHNNIHLDKLSESAQELAMDMLLEGFSPEWVKGLTTGKFNFNGNPTFKNNIEKLSYNWNSLDALSKHHEASKGKGKKESNIDNAYKTLP